MSRKLIGKIRRQPVRRSIGPVRSEESQTAILDAAAAILREGGVDHFTIEEVARRAHASKPTIYKWWGEKFTLIADAYRRATPLGVESGNNPVREEIKELYRQIWAMWSEPNYAHTSRRLLSEAMASQELVVRYREGYLAERIAPLMAILQSAQKGGQFDEAADIELLKDIFVGFHMLRMLLDRPVSDAEIDKCIGILFDGFGSGTKAKS